MTSLIIFLLGAAGAGFIVGALFVHWSYKPVRFEQSEHELLVPGHPVRLSPVVNGTVFVVGNPEHKGDERYQILEPEQYLKLFPESADNDCR